MALTGMIFDRTQSDVDALIHILKLVKASGYDALPGAQKVALMNANNKGGYSHLDANRVITAYRQLIADLAAQGIIVETTADTLPTYTNADRMTPEQGAAYLQMIENVRQALTVGDDTPATPDSMNNLSYEGANAIEKILYDVSVLIDNMIAGAYFSGEIYAGEV